MKTKSTKPALPPDAKITTAADAFNEIKEWNTEATQELYLAGYTFYKQGNYAEATHFFRVMTNLNPKDRRGWMGLGASLQMQLAFEEAIEAYIVADLAQAGEDPRIPLHAAECLWSLNRPQEAKKALQGAKKRAETQKKQRILDKIAVFETMWAEGNRYDN